MSAMTRPVSGQPNVLTLLMLALLAALPVGGAVAVLVGRNHNNHVATTPQAMLDVAVELTGAAESYAYLQSVLVEEGVAIPVEDRDHAVARHGADALSIREACNNGGFLRLYQSRSWKTPLKFYVLCMLPDGRVGLRILEIVGGTDAMRRVIERTSFFVKGGTFAEAIEYVTACAVEIFEPLSRFLAR
jgi:hypothetical protein